MKVTIISIVIGTLGTVTKGLVQRLEDLEIKRTSGDHPNYCIIEIGEETLMSLKPSLTDGLMSLKPSLNAGVKNSQKITNNNNNCLLE